MDVRFALFTLLFSAPLAASPSTLSSLETAPVGFESTGNGFEAHTEGGSIQVNQAGASLNFHGQTARIDFYRGKPCVMKAEGDAGTENRLVGNRASEWRTGIPLAERVRAVGVYPGIDVLWHGRGRQLEYDFVVAPHASPAQIALRIRGGSAVTLDAEGNLRAGAANREMIHRRPTAYQTVDGIKRYIDSRFVIARRGYVRFLLGAYDHSAPLIIDPVVGYSSYLGGSAADEAHAVAIDAAGNLYIAGVTYSTTSGLARALLLKVPPTGNPVRSIFGGSTGNDIANGVVVDSSGYVYIVGSTSSPDFPIAGSLVIQSQIFSSGTTKAFLIALTPDNTTPVFSGYFGGSYNDQAQAIAIGPNKLLYIVGDTNSPDFLANFVSASTFQYSNHGGYDGFVLSLSTQAIFSYATYLGGSGDDHAYSVAADKNGSAYVAGSTASTDFPARNSFDSTYRGGTDAFAIKFYPDGTLAYWSTFLGGAKSDAGYGIAVGTGGNTYVAGITASTDFPTSAGTYQTTYQGGSSDGFVFALSSTGAKGLWSTFLGTPAADAMNAISIDASDNLYVTGTTDSAAFPVTSDAVQSAAGGSQDAIISKLNASGTSLLFSTYFGGTGADTGTAIYVDSSARIFFAGITGPAGTTSTTDDFPTVNAYQASYGGGISDAFFAAFGCAGTLPAISAGGVVNGASYLASAVAPGALISVFGTNLACAAASSSVTPLPTTLAGITVKVNGTAIPLFFVSEAQINAQLPFNTPEGTATMTVTTPAGISASASVPVVTAGPGIFIAGTQAAILNQDGTLNTSTNGAKPGSVVTVYFSGQGPITPAIATGTTAPTSPLSTATSAYYATIGGASATVNFLGMAPGFVALAQANLTVPALPNGAYPVLLNIAGFNSQPASLTITANSQ